MAVTVRLVSGGERAEERIALLRNALCKLSRKSRRFTSDARSDRSARTVGFDPAAARVDVEVAVNEQRTAKLIVGREVHVQGLSGDRGVDTALPWERDRDIQVSHIGPELVAEVLDHRALDGDPALAE
jgi:hypothetical protein